MDNKKKIKELEEQVKKLKEEDAAIENATLADVMRELKEIKKKLDAPQVIPVSVPVPYPVYPRPYYPYPWTQPTITWTNPYTNGWSMTGSTSGSIQITLDNG